MQDIKNELSLFLFCFLNTVKQSNIVKYYYNLKSLFFLNILRNISYQCRKQLFCLIFLWKL